MMKGIQVHWFNADGQVEEIVYFYGIDVDQLDDIPEFTAVQAVWPGWEGGNPAHQYVVDAHCERNPDRPDEVRLVVVYDPANNPELAEEWGDEIYWGKNTIVLQPGNRHGHCEWLRDGAEDWEEVEWKAFGAVGARPRATYRGSRREASFRKMILACDDRRCVLTGEKTIKALDAAHLIPAAKGENDVPSNGITLRADLHRLFDAGLFTLSADGRVEAAHPGLSKHYRNRLQDKRLTDPTLGRVRATLGLPEFRNRPNAR